MYSSVDDPKVTRSLSVKKSPSFIYEAVWCSVTILMIKLYSDAAFGALTFTTVLLPLMAFFILSIVFNILKFIKLLHTEEVDEEDGGILSSK